MKMRGNRRKISQRKICVCCNGETELDRAYEKKAERDVEETKAKISASVKKAWENGIERKPRTEEHIAKLAASNKARTGWKHTEESKAKMREAQARRKGRKDV